MIRKGIIKSFSTFLIRGRNMSNIEGEEGRRSLSQQEFLEASGLKPTEYADYVDIHWNTISRRKSRGKSRINTPSEVEALWRVILELGDGPEVRKAFERADKARGGAVAESWRQKRSDQQKEAYEKRKGE